MTVVHIELIIAVLGLLFVLVGGIIRAVLGMKREASLSRKELFRDQGALAGRVTRLETLSEGHSSSDEAMAGDIKDIKNCVSEQKQILGEIRGFLHREFKKD